MILLSTMRGSLTAPQQTICTAPASSLLPPSLPLVSVSISPSLSISLCFCMHIAISLSAPSLAVPCPTSFYTFSAYFSMPSLSSPYISLRFPCPGPACLSLYAFPILTFLSLCPSLYSRLSVPISLFPSLFLISLFPSLYSYLSILNSLLPSL
jgi:hypothetical protein